MSKTLKQKIDFLLKNAPIPLDEVPDEIIKYFKDWLTQKQQLHTATDEYGQGFLKAFEILLEDLDTLFGDNK